MDNLAVDVLYGAEQSSGIDSEKKPLIAISASYDSFGAIPNLPAGVSRSESPILALLYLSKTFS